MTFHGGSRQPVARKPIQGNAAESALTTDLILATGKPKPYRAASTSRDVVLGLVIVTVAGWLAYQAWDFIALRKDTASFLAGQPQARSCADPVIAYRAMQRLVLQQLRAPRAARFPAPDAVSMRPGPAECSYAFTAHVDTENEYGAAIRTDFTASIAYDFVRGGWRLRDYGERRR